MSQQYIQIENQTLLWKTIQRSPQFVNNTVNINREQWFSNIIKHFYNQLTTSTCSITELKQLNQQTITYMLNDLKRIESTAKPYSGVTSRIPEEFRRMNDISSSIGLTGEVSHRQTYETTQSRMTMYNDQFNARQQEYTNMLKPPAPPIADFGEKVEDEVITNVDELVQQQLKQR